MPNRGFAFLFIVTIQYSQHEAFHFGGLVFEIWNFSGAWGLVLGVLLGGPRRNRVWLRAAL